MEEDIKIVEELVEHNYLEDVSYLREDNDYKKFNQAIENLIKGYRKSEMENQSYRDYLGEPPCYDNASYIPKSKIKEKIEELESKIKATFCKYMTEEDYYNNKFLSSDVAEDYEVLEVRKLISNRYLLQELMEDK